MNIGELFVKLGIVSDVAKVKAFKSAVEGATAKVFSLKNAVALATLYGLDRFVSGTIESVAAMRNLNEQTGLSIDQLRKWQIAGQMGNIAMSADEISSSIVNLQKNITAIRLGGGNVRPFQLLGINIAGKNAFQILDEMRDKIAGMSRPIATNLLEQAGLNPNFITLLHKSRDEFEKLAKVDFLNKDQRKQIMLLGQELKLLKLNLSYLKDMLVVNFKPMWSGIIQLIDSASRAFGFLSEKLSQSSPAIGMLKVALASLMITLFPLTSLLLGLLLVIDDIHTYMKGGKSITGDVMEFLYGKQDKNHPADKRVGAIERIKNAWDRGYFFGDWKKGENEFLTEQLKKTGTPQSSAQFTNTFNIYGAEDAENVASVVSDRITTQYKSAIAEGN